LRSHSRANARLRALTARVALLRCAQVLDEIGCATSAAVAAAPSAPRSAARAAPAPLAADAAADDAGADLQRRLAALRAA
jgi:hypothetical protein